MALHKTVDSPLVREVTFGDMADPHVQAAVLNLIKSTMPNPSVIPDHEWIAKLTAGGLEAFWVLTEDGQPAGLVTFETGWMPEIEARGLYVVSACVAPHISDDGWRKLLAYGKALARARACQVIQFDTLPENKRMLELGGVFGGAQSHARCVGGVKTIRFTIEVSKHG